MLSETDLVRVGISRIRLPAPTAKLLVMHAIARGLTNTSTAEIVSQSLLGWISRLSLESEVLEALGAIDLARGGNSPSLDELRSSIAKPSLLSDAYLQEIFGQPVALRTCAQSHSGEAPARYSSDAVLDELKAGHVVPLILYRRLESLEERWSYPFLSQWLFEFDRLAEMNANDDGHWSYFVHDEDRQHGRGHFIGRRGHIARSAYLRTLALAGSAWGMPDQLALSEATYASPFDHSLLRMPPGDAPPWAIRLHDANPQSESEFENLLSDVDTHISENGGPQLLLHFNGPLRRDANYQADLEIASFYVERDDVYPENAFGLHDWLVGKMFLKRTQDWAFESEQSVPRAFEIASGVAVIPTLVPVIARFSGYIHSDITRRMPYLPANYGREGTLIAQPRPGGADITFRGEVCGELKYWNYRWFPTHHDELAPGCAVALTISSNATAPLFQAEGTKLVRFWRATVLTRETDYGQWKKLIHSGVLPSIVD